MDMVFQKRNRALQPPSLTHGYKSTIFRAPKKPLVPLNQGLGDVTGPVFGHEIIGPMDHDLVHNFAKAGESAIGPRIIVHGRVMDENNKPVPNVLVEMWQANAGGRYRHKNDDYLAPLDPNFGGFGRAITGDDGAYEFFTIQPGAYPWPNHENAWRPQHIHFSLFGTGFAQRLITQMYFEGDPLIPLCPIVSTIPDPSAIERLIAPLDMSRAISMDRLAYRFDIVLRGKQSTLFENKLEGN